MRAASINRKWRHFLSNSTLHGLQYVFNSETKFRSIIWAAFLLMCTGHFVYKSSLLLRAYYSYEVTSKVTVKYEKSPEFPAVTICHFNMLRESFVKEFKAEKLLEIAFRRSSLRTKVNRSEVTWKEFGNASMEDVYEEGGHQIKKMMKTCSWSGEKCDARNFTRILTPMGLCHTFNSGKLYIKSKLQVHQHCEGKKRWIANNKWGKRIRFFLWGDFQYLHSFPRERQNNYSTC